MGPRSGQGLSGAPRTHRDLIPVRSPQGSHRRERQCRRVDRAAVHHRVVSAAGGTPASSRWALPGPLTNILRLQKIVILSADTTEDYVVHLRPGTILIVALSGGGVDDTAGTVEEVCRLAVFLVVTPRSIEVSPRPRNRVVVTALHGHHAACSLRPTVGAEVTRNAPQHRGPRVPCWIR